jgi:CRP-like cAMP-binding protein
MQAAALLAQVLLKSIARPTKRSLIAGTPGGPDEASDSGAEEPLTPPLDCSTCALGPVAVYSPTYDAQPSTITNLRKGIRYVAGKRTIFHEGERPDVICTLYSGWACRFRLLPSGRRQIVSFLIPGDVISPELHLFGKNYVLPFGVKSITAVQLCVFDLEAFIRACDSKEQKQQFQENGAHYVAALYRRLTDTGRGSAASRIARLFLEFEERLRRRNLTQGGAFHLPLRHENIADALGLTTVHVSRILSGLREDGIVSFEDKTVRIRDEDRLRRVAEDF